MSKGEISSVECCLRIIRTSLGTSVVGFTAGTTILQLVVSVATYATSRALASSPDALRADSDLRAYGPCHRRDGTAGTPELLPQLSQPGLSTISDDYGPAVIRRSMDLATAAGASATRMSRLRAGDAAGGRGPERRRATGPTTTQPQGAGRRVSQGARDSECSASQLDAACAEYLLF